MSDEQCPTGVHSHVWKRLNAADDIHEALLLSNTQLTKKVARLETAIRELQAGRVAVEPSESMAAERTVDPEDIPEAPPEPAAFVDEVLGGEPSEAPEGLQGAVADHAARFNEMHPQAAPGQKKGRRQL